MKKQKKLIPLNHNNSVIGYMSKLNKKTGVAEFHLYDTPVARALIKKAIKEDPIPTIGFAMPMQGFSISGKIMEGESLKDRAIALSKRKLGVKKVSREIIYTNINEK